MYLTQPLHRAKQQYPSRTATIFADRTRTYEEYVERVSRLAGGLRACGVKRGDRVAILALNSDCYLEYLAAVPWADAVLVPVNTRWSREEILTSLRDCRARALFIDAEFAPMLAALRPALEDMTLVIYTGPGQKPNTISHDELINNSPPVPDARRAGDELAALFYTGGTTGASKGVMLSHHNLMTSALGAAASGFWATPAGRYLHAAPMFHLADLCVWLTHSLVGSTHVVIPKFDPDEVLAAAARHQVTDLFLVPTMIQMIVDHARITEFDLSALKRLCYGASPISEGLLDRTLKLFPDVALAQAYGMTELSPIATLLGPEEHRDTERRRLSSAGRAVAHSEVAVVDDVGVELPPGAIGEVVSRGGHVMIGYWERPNETAQALRDGWMHTGDAGYLDHDGYLYIVDRLKDMIVSGGENVYSAEVESALSTHPGVAANAVIGVPDPTYGERVHAVVVRTTGIETTEQQLRDHVKDRIGGYKAPRSFEFIEELPKSAAGKVLKRQLRARHWDTRERNV